MSVDVSLFTEKTQNTLFPENSSIKGVFRVFFGGNSGTSISVKLMRLPHSYLRLIWVDYSRSKIIILFPVEMYARNNFNKNPLNLTTDNILSSHLNKL